MRRKLFREIVPEVVFGGVDGTISTFAVVAGAYGGGLSKETTFILGLASLVADGFSMAVGAYFSAQADEDSNSPIREGVTTFTAFVAFGSFLLIPYIAGQIISLEASFMFWSSAIIAISSFAVVGLLKAKAEDERLPVGALQVVSLGIVAAIIAFGLGKFLESLIT